MAMMQPQKQKPLLMSEAEYLEFEEKSEIRHEYVGGKVYAMAGAEWEHTMIAQSASSALYAQLRGKRCKIGTNDLKLKVQSEKVSYCYPDFMVICDEPNFVGSRTIIDNPTLIVEVLSPSTALEDWNTKLSEYTALSSVMEYMLISQNEAKIVVFSRDESGKWLYQAVSGLESSLDLPSIGCTLALADVYEQVSLDNEDNNTGDTQNEN